MNVSAVNSSLASPISVYVERKAHDHAVTVVALLNQSIGRTPPEVNPTTPVLGANVDKRA